MSHHHNSETHRLKREVLVRLVKAFLSDDFAENARRIPFDMRPKGAEVPFRCCIYKERAVLRARAIAGLGASIEDDDEQTPLSDYARAALARAKPEEEPLTVLEAACKGCPSSKVMVTELCQNCVARPCLASCKFGAIHNVHGRSAIDQEKCRKCGLCLQACHYNAIIKTVVPCENACPVGAISKDEKGFARIDSAKCITCGKCVGSCPFGAVHAKSQLIDVLHKIKQGEEVVALAAPALFGQLPCPPAQMHAAIKRIGFSHVYEVAQGADTTARTEAHDFKERMARGDAFMTTSCCAAYNELVARHLPEIKPFVSDTKTPLFYTAEIAKRERPGAVAVFLSPCAAKRVEAAGNPNVDYVLDFEELGALLVALGIDAGSCGEGEAFAYESSKEARNFAVSGGVAQSVVAALVALAGEDGGSGENRGAEAKPFAINGLDKNSIRNLRICAKAGKCEQGNLVEAMSCEGGCIGGNAALASLKEALRQVSEYGEKGKSLAEEKG